MRKRAARDVFARAEALRTGFVARLRAIRAAVDRPDVRAAVAEFERAASVVEELVVEAARGYFLGLGIEKGSLRGLARSAPWILELARGNARARHPGDAVAVAATRLKGLSDESLYELLSRPETFDELDSASAVLIAGLRRRLARAAPLSQRAAALRAARAAFESVRGNATTWRHELGERPVRRALTLSWRSPVRARGWARVPDLRRTIVPMRVARACGAIILPVADKELAWHPQREESSRWFRGRPAVLWIAIPRTRWRAPVWALAVPSRDAREPMLGDDFWLLARHGERE